MPLLPETVDAQTGIPVTDQAHALVVCTATCPDPPMAPNVVPVGDRLYAQPDLVDGERPGEGRARAGDSDGAGPCAPGVGGDGVGDHAVAGPARSHR